MATQDEQTQFQCHFCPKTFGRQEHLTRHVRAHTREKPYGCLQCNKSFSRQDVLQRHLSTHNSSVTSRSTVSARACKECAAGRIRCSRELPCGRCKERDLECIYPNTRKRKTRSMTQQRALNPHSPGSSSSGNLNEDSEVRGDPQAAAEAAVVMDNDAIGNGGGIGWIADGHQPIETTSTARAWPSTNGVITAEPIPEPVFQINSLGDFTMDRAAAEPNTGTLNVNWLNDSQYLSMWESQLSAVPDGLGSMALTFPSAFARPNPISPWIPTHYDAADGTSKEAHEQGYTPSSMAAASPHRSQTDSIRGSSASKSTDGALYVEGTMARAPFRGQLSRRHMNQHRSPSVAGPGSHLEAPDSLEVSSQAGSLYHVSDEVYSKLVLAVSEHTQAYSQGSTASLVPPLGHIRCFVRLYYENFHDTYPFLRKGASTWQDSNNWILLLAISAIGAKYLGGTSSPSISGLLETVLDHKLSLMSRENNQGSHDIWTPGCPRSQLQLDLATLQAVILSVISGLHSGQKASIERALSQRYMLIEECRRMNLLSRTPPQFDTAMVSDDGSIIAAWLQSQSEIRTGLMLWILDSIIAYEFDCPHLLQLHEVKTILPCQEGTWDQPTLEQIRKSGGHQTTILEALHLLYMEKRQPSNLTEFGNIVMIYAVCRRTQEAAYQHETALSRWTPVAHVEHCSEPSTVAESWPPRLDSITRWRNSACDCLDILHWKANGKAANAGGSEHPTILLLHLSRLYLLAPCKHLQRVATCAALSKASNGRYDTPGYSEACSHLHRWANVDQYKARLSIIHSGALLWHIRRYSSNSFMEPHAIYIATLLVWAYSVFAARSTASESLPNEVIANHVPQGSDNVAATPQCGNDDEEEEPEPAFIHLDRPCDDEMVQTYIRLGHKMQGYMQRVGNIGSSDAPPKILKEGLRLLSHTRAKEKAWGIETSFLESLTSLLEASTTQESGRLAESGLF